MISIDYISDWAARLKTRLYTQFRNAVTWNQWIDEIIAPQFQDLEDSAQTMFSLMDIDNSEGVNLDVIGRIVGQPRLGATDTTYRLYLRARIAANLSTGTPEEIYTVFKALYGATIGLKVTTSAIGAKVFQLRVTGLLTRLQASVGSEFLRSAKESGSRALLEWQESETAALFVYDGTTAQGYDAGLYAGAYEV